MTANELAALHAISFTIPRPWTAKEFQNLLQSKGVFLITRTNGFILGRVAGPELELLTLAVAPDARRSGQGSALLSAFEEKGQQLGAAEVFLEVSAENTPALILYEKAGYGIRGRRRNYYVKPDGRKCDAIIMRKSLP